MPVRIRLQRHGKKGKPFYWIVAADSRSKRDGRYLEKIGTYNPNTNPASVELDVDQAVKWLENGAQPSDTARTLLSYRGAMLKHHLNGGVKKGAFSQEEADKRFADWLKEKQAKIQSKIDGLDKQKADSNLKRLEAEKAVNQKRIAELSAPPEAEEVIAEDAEATKVENTETNEGAIEVSEEKVAAVETEIIQEAEISTEEATEKPATEESIAEETSSEEVPEEASVEEPKAEENPAEMSNSDDATADDNHSEDNSAEEEETKE
tara:strand:- start:69089 stop:69880 length:792 start_codon:yes stop_codon:yes gene_type:complete